MPDFVTPEQYVRYLNDYATQFKLWESIRCGYRVQRICRAFQGRGHVVTVTNTSDESFQWNCDAIAICSGLNVHPNIPYIPGLNHVPVVLHSSQLKERKQFGVDTDVVILGAGETGMDLGHLAITSPTRSVTVCHREGFFCAPKVHHFACTLCLFGDDLLPGRLFQHRDLQDEESQNLNRTNQWTHLWRVCLTRHMLTRFYNEVPCCGQPTITGSNQCIC
jgi:hypothetical protein